MFCGWWWYCFGGGAAAVAAFGLFSLNLHNTGFSHATLSRCMPQSPLSLTPWTPCVPHSLPLCPRSTARACQLTRGLLPMLATPGPNGDAVLESAIVAAAAAGLVAPRHHVVVLQQIHEDFCVKVSKGNGSDYRFLST